MKKGFFILVFLVSISGFSQEIKVKAETFSLQFEQAYAEGNPDVLFSAFDVETLVQKVAEGLYKRLEKAPEEDADFDAKFNAMMEGVRGAWGSNKLAQAILENMTASEFKLKFLKVEMPEAGAEGLFRLFNEGVFNYLVLYYHLDPKGNLRVNDAKFFDARIRFSTNLESALFTFLKNDESLVSRILGKNKTLIKDFEAMSAIREKILDGNYAEANTLYEGFSKEGKKLESAMILALGFKLEISEQAFIETVDFYQKIYPNHPALNLQMIDAGVILKNYKLSLQALDKLDESIGIDPYLDLVRGNIYYTAGDLDKAEAYYQKSSKLPEAEEDALWSLITLTLERKTYEETVRQLKVMETKFDLDFDLDQLREIAAYVDFGKSDAYSKWRVEKGLVE